MEPQEIDPREAAKVLGRIGGRAKTPAKRESSRRNGRLGGRPKMKREPKEKDAGGDTSETDG